MPTVANTGTRLHSLQTAAFINADPIWLTLRRQVKEADGRGGMKVTGEEDRIPQRVRVVGQRRRATHVTPDGKEVTVDKVVVGPSTLVVEIDDLFTFNGRTYQVINVQDSPVWRIHAEATRRG